MVFWTETYLFHIVITLFYFTRSIQMSLHTFLIYHHHSSCAQMVYNVHIYILAVLKHCTVSKTFALGKIRRFFLFWKRDTSLRRTSKNTLYAHLVLFHIAQRLRALRWRNLEMAIQESTAVFRPLKILFCDLRHFCTLSFSLYEQRENWNT